MTKMFLLVAFLTGPQSAATVGPFTTLAACEIARERVKLTPAFHAQKAFCIVNWVL